MLVGSVFASIPFFFLLTQWFLPGSISDAVSTSRLFLAGAPKHGNEPSAVVVLSPCPKEHVAPERGSIGWRERNRDELIRIYSLSNWIWCQCPGQAH